MAAAAVPSSAALNGAAAAAPAGGAAPAAAVSLAPVQDTSDLGPYEDLKPQDEKPQSLISHLVSSLTSGQDLTRVLIPTFFLEPRSLLEKYTDLWAHPQLILNIAAQEDPVQRMLTMVRWYVSGWHIRPRIGAVHSLCKKPYNPILGEEFFAHWEHADSRTDFFAEQVSHHPPVSAIYIENRAKHITINAHIYAKSKFLGNSAACESVGAAHFNLTNRPGEEYVLTFPTYYACGLFIGKLRMEIGDKTKIICKKTGLSAEFEFRTKGMISGEYNRVKGHIKRDTGKHEKLYTLDGKWDSVIKLHNLTTKKDEVLFDLSKTETHRKFVAPVAAQDPFESRRAWDAVSTALQKHDHNTATSAKTILEDAQRKAAAERDAKKIVYKQKMFTKAGSGWVFNHSDLRPYDAKEPLKPLPCEYHKYGRDPALKAAAAAPAPVAGALEAAPNGKAADGKSSAPNAANAPAPGDVVDAKTPAPAPHVPGAAVAAAPTQQPQPQASAPMALADFFAAPAAAKLTPS